MDRRIKAAQVRLVGEQGESLGVRPLAVALALAQEAGLNLVEVAPRERPPVCRLMDYGRHRFQQSKTKSAKAPRPKELQLRARIGEHDLQLKLTTLRRFLGEGHPVRVSVTFRGRERAHPEVGQRLIQRALEAVRDVAQAEQPPLLQGRELSARLLPTTPRPRPTPTAPPTSAAGRSPTSATEGPRRL